MVTEDIHRLGARLLESVPVPRTEELPTEFAARVGEWYASAAPEEHRRTYAQYFTPPVVARFMAERGVRGGPTPRMILDPAAGSGTLLCAVLETTVAGDPALSSVAADAYEVDPMLAGVARVVFDHAQRWLGDRGVSARIKVFVDDFLRAHRDVVESRPRLWKSVPSAAKYDLVVCNPPYFKLSKSDPRALAAASVVHGQPNIYGLFMAYCAALVRSGGSWVFITPRSFTAGPYFRKLREYLFARIRPTAIHLFGSRRAAFRRDAVLQENVILVGRSLDIRRATAEPRTVLVSTSEGVNDLSAARTRTVSIDTVLKDTAPGRILHIPTTGADDKAAEVVSRWPNRLASLGLRVSTGPVVAFRARKLLVRGGSSSDGCVPFLWVENVRTMQVVWPSVNREKPNLIRSGGRAARLLLPDRNYVLVRRFSAKEERRRIVAAPLETGQLGSDAIGVENHLNYIYRPHGTMDREECVGLGIVLNSGVIDRYFRSFNGNTQVSAFELAQLPLPSLEALRALALTALGNPEACSDDILGAVLGRDTGLKPVIAGRPARG